MSDWNRKLCETDADWKAYERNPTGATWANYVESKTALDALGCCENMWVALCSHDILKYEDGTYRIYGETMMVDDGGTIGDMTDMYLISYCPFCGRKLR